MIIFIGSRIYFNNLRVHWIEFKVENLIIYFMSWTLRPPHGRTMPTQRFLLSSIILSRNPHHCLDSHDTWLQRYTEVLLPISWSVPSYFNEQRFYLIPKLFLPDWPHAFAVASRLWPHPTCHSHDTDTRISGFNSLIWRTRTVNTLLTKSG